MVNERITIQALTATASCGNKAFLFCQIINPSTKLAYVSNIYMRESEGELLDIPQGITALSIILKSHFNRGSLLKPHIHSHISTLQLTRSWQELQTKSQGTSTCRYSVNSTDISKNAGKCTNFVKRNNSHLVGWSNYLVKLFLIKSYFDVWYCW